MEAPSYAGVAKSRRPKRLVRQATTHRVSPVVASNAYSWSLDCPANAAYRTPLSNDGVPVRAPLKPSLRSHWIVPLYGSRARRWPSHVVSNNVPSAKIGLLHRLVWQGPADHRRVRGGRKTLGDTPCRGGLFWNVGDSVLAGAVGGRGGVVNVKKFVPLSSVAVLPASSVERT